MSSPAAENRPMNCDLVFDVLTRGPFPSGGAEDEAVERHLGRCAGCRRLAEALRPAVELLAETIGPEDGRDLPRYWGEPRGPEREGFDYGPGEGTAATAVGTAMQVAAPAAAVTLRWERLVLAGSALAAGVLLALVFQLGAGFGPPRSVAGPYVAAAMPAPEPRLLLAGLPVACRFWDPASEPRDPPPGSPSGAPASGGSRPGVYSPLPELTATALAEQRCCTDCHGSTGSVRLVASHALDRILQSCTACHEP
jgi:hypothetical protein